MDSDVRVSHDGDVVHMETYISASATNPNLLVAGGELIFPGRRTAATEAQIYRSTDVGARWNAIPLPNEVNGGWDNAIAGARGGSAFFLTSNSERGLTLYRTDDGGSSWSSTGLGVRWDRPYIAVDNDGGSLYVIGEADDGVRFTRSVDGGKTFAPAVTACPHPNGWNAAAASSPLILSDGTVVVPCLPYPNDPERASWTNAEVGVVSSRDGGRSFSPYHKVFSIQRAPESETRKARAQGLVMLAGNFMQGPAFVVGPPAGQFADRIYAAWQDISGTDESRLLISHSHDRGVTWSAPVPIDSSPSAGGTHILQGVPMVAVSPDGVLGVAWFDSRHSPDGKGYDVYFSASLDGGQTFLPATRVSTATSPPASGLNILPTFDVVTSAPGDQQKIEIASPFSERATGGDNSSMAVDAAGRFHPLWLDARSGVWQVYTATVHVLSEAQRTQLLSRSACPVKVSDLQPLFDEPELDRATEGIVVPLRILNISSGPIVEAVTIRVAPLRAALTASGPGALSEPSVTSDGATSFVFRFTPASPLFPNAVSAPVAWRLPAGEFADYTFAVEQPASACGRSSTQ